jgi:N-acylneuraminate cytidylyltransferase
MGMPDAIAIILGRGGSKGLPRKNVLPVNGKPCVQWTIEAAQRARCIREVVVSSDDAELLELARGLGARAVARPAELASDTATVDAAARHAVSELERASGSQLSPSQPLVILYANVPVRPEGLIDRAVALLVEQRGDSVQSYAPVGKYHPWWMARVDSATGTVRPWEGGVLNHGVFRRQDLPPAFVPDGGVIAVKREALMLEIPGVSPGPHAFFGREDRRRGIINNGGSVIDIDSKIDMMVAEAMLATRPR